MKFKLLQNGIESLGFGTYIPCMQPSVFVHYFSGLFGVFQIAKESAWSFGADLKWTRVIWGPDRAAESWTHFSFVILGKVSHLWNVDQFYHPATHGRSHVTLKIGRCVQWSSILKIGFCFISPRVGSKGCENVMLHVASVWPYPSGIYNSSRIRHLKGLIRPDRGLVKYRTREGSSWKYHDLIGYWRTSSGATTDIPAKELSYLVENDSIVKRITLVSSSVQ